MKKKWFQRGVCATLCMSLMLGLAACGGKNNNGKGSQKQDPALAKQYVYSMQEISEISDMGDDVSIRSTVRAGDKIYFLITAHHYNSSSEQEDHKIVSMNGDGTNVKMADLEQNIVMEDSGDGENEENGGSDNNGGNGGSDVGIMPLARTVVTPEASATITVAPATAESSESTQDTDTTQDESEAGEEEASEDTADIDIDDGVYLPGQNIYENVSYSRFAFASDAELLYGVKTHRKEDYNDPMNPVSLMENWLCAWDMDGALLWERDMKELYDGSEDYWINQATALPDGSLLVMLEAESTTMLTVDKNGNVVKTGKLGTADDNLSRLVQYVTKGDGSTYVLYYDQDWRYLYVADYDFETGKMAEGQQLPEKLSMMGYNALAGGTNSDLVISTTGGLYTYNMGDEDITQMMSFVNSDLFTNGFSDMIMLNDDCFIGIYNDIEDDYTTKVAFFNKVNPEDIPDKEVMVLAAFYVDYEMRKRIVEFNKTSDKYRIVYKEYESYATEEDYMAGYTQLNNDIISGNMPDMLVCNSAMPVDSYISKGLLADIGAMIEADEELSKAGFMENVLDAYKVNGTLYYILPSFAVNTIVGKTSILGNKTSWNMQEFCEMMESLPEGTEGFGRVTRDGFMYDVMSYCGSDFVDMSTGKCNFNSQDFIEMLEYAATLPTDIDYSDKADDDYWMNYESQWREDRTLLYELYLSNMRDVNRSIKGYFGENVTFIGFPTESGKGSVINVNSFYAISAKSANQEGAWEFLRYYLTEEYQDDLGWMIPTNKNSYEKWLREAMEKPYWENEIGEKIEYDETFYMNGEEIPVDVMSQAEVDRIDAFIKSIDKPAYWNQEVQNIVLEEAGAFFQGQKSAKDVAGVIQSRVKMYVNE